ncbi:hypothetical protein TSAR_001164 [Trichomalopsis sarcophagae]|uniref:Uncharacterized protein n=1 Tax=Trichomalopsis sarcophagae TaxID=543379 RepID=A0A232EQ08_9HYME|nr:hypothetical protein TSAR_001164 [Trichomalopsis sarcophagae]
MNINSVLRERDERRGCATVSCGLVAIARGSSSNPEDDAKSSGAVTSNRHDGSADITATQGLCWAALVLFPIGEQPLIPALTGEVINPRRTG